MWNKESSSTTAKQEEKLDNPIPENNIYMYMYMGESSKFLKS